MKIIQTDQWMLNHYEEPLKLCEKLTAYFNQGITESNIYNHLVQHGMYIHPTKNGKKSIQKLQRKRLWDYLKKEGNQLQKLWDGPTIPVFIFLSNQDNRQLNIEYNGKSGLAFRDKLFLFINDGIEKKEVKALITHEYNHTCRLTSFNKKENDYCLLDTVILEGLAENAVRKRCGEQYLAPWTSYYSNVELQNMWEKFVRPNRNISTFHSFHHTLLYGRKFYPKMVGYAVGYFIVKSYMEKYNTGIEELLSLPSEEFIQHLE